MIETARLRLTRFAMPDADELFACITPAVTRYLAWDPPARADFDARCAAVARAEGRTELSLVIRRQGTGECLGLTAVERLAEATPELGLWLKETAHGQGYGRETVEAVARWASATHGKAAFVYPVAVQNTASRRIAERLGGEVIATRSDPKYDAVVYRIPAPT